MSFVVRSVLSGFSVACLVSIAIPCASQQPSTTITGKITNQIHLPVVGALVSIPSLRLSTQTNEAGVYHLVVPVDRAAEAESIHVQRIGFEPRVFAIALRPGVNTADMILAEQAVALNEVVVSGTAGNLERRAQAAVVATVDAPTIVQAAQITTVPQLLSGRVSGVSVTQSNGLVGSTSVIRMRGVSSISLSNDPLVFIDGVRTETRNIFVGGGGAVSTLHNIDPSTIESIEVVKGPAAATLYGADASAGVLQIITKKGAPGTNGFSQSISLERNTARADWTPPSNFGTCGAADVLPTSTSTLCRGQTVGAIVSDNPIEREHLLRHGDGGQLQWQGRGGGDAYGYFLAYGYTDETGTAPTNDVLRHNARTNFTILPRQNLTIDGGLGVLREVNDQMNVGDNGYGLLAALQGSPLTVGGAANGWFAPNRNGVAITSIENRITTTRFEPNVSARYQPFSWLSNRLVLGGDINQLFYSQFFPKNDLGWYSGNTNTGQVSETRLALDAWTLDYLADIRHDLGRGWSGDLSLGTQVIDRAVDSLSATGYGLATNSSNTVSATTTNSAAGGRINQRFVGYLGQVQLEFANRLFLQYGARIDRNSAFVSASQTFFLPKYGISYVLSDEPFWQRHAPWMNTLRLRAAYGTTGRAPEPGASLQTYSNAPYMANDGTASPGVIPLNPGNAGLRAEHGAEFETGFESGLFHDRVGVDFTFFNKITRDLLIQLPIPKSLGFTQNPFVNIGRASNRGVEIGLQAQLLTLNDVGLAVHGNVATLRNRLESLGGVAPITTGVNGFAQYRQGYPFGGWWSRRVQSADVTRGVAVVSDTNQYGGSPIPTYQGSFAGDLTVRHNFRLTGLLEFKGGNKKFNMTPYFREKSFTSEQRFQERGNLAPEERLRLFGPYVNSQGQAVASSVVIDDYLQDASFVRLRELSLSWTVPAGYAEHIRASSATITAGGRNLALWTRYSGGWDPESITYVPTNGISFAADFLTIPEPQQFFVRLNLGF